MSYFILTLFFFLDVVGAILIAKYQEHNGYKFINSFVGALIGLIGLTALGVKTYLELIK